MIGETYLGSIKDLDKWYGTNNDELDLPMDMQVGFRGARQQAGHGSVPRADR